MGNSNLYKGSLSIIILKLLKENDKMYGYEITQKVKELTNKEVTLENIVDENILGGFILRVGDKQYNASISNNFNKLKREFTLN